MMLQQAFREAVVSAGDVATLVVTVTNITDSLRVDNLVVTEAAHPVLDFSSSPAFTSVGRQLRWDVGSLSAGESRTAVIKFVANSRVSQGHARVTGGAGGVAVSGQNVVAAPVTSLVKIENDIFAAEGVILGDVFVDDNRNGRRDLGEQGIPGAAVHLESGEYVLSDSLGVFSVPRVFAGYRIVRLDESTIPDDVVFAESLGGFDNAAGRGNERIVHLLPGGHARVAFPLLPRPPATIEVTHTVGFQEKVSIRRQARLYQAFVVPSSYFSLGKSKLMKGEAHLLSPLVEFLEEHPGWGVFLEGHTDSLVSNVMDFPSNYELSVARAEAVQRYLEAEGISGDRCIVRGHGDSRPIATNATIGGRRNNRRVEISFVPPGVALNDNGLVRENTTVRDFTELPDTCNVAVFWEMVTSSVETSDGRVYVHLPRSFPDPEVDVRFDGRPLSRNPDGSFSFDGFARSRRIEATVTFSCAAEDTIRIKDIRAVLRFDSGPNRGVGPITIRPLLNGPSSQRTERFDVLEWQQTELLSVYEDRIGKSVSPAVSGTTLTPGDTATALATVPKGDVALVEPFDGRVFQNRDQVTVTARVPVGSVTALLSGKETIDNDRIGRRIVDPSGGMELVTWYGVHIAPGWNDIILSVRRPDGSVAADTVRVALSGQPRVLTAMRERYQIQANGYSTQNVRFAVRDGWGLPVTDGIVVSVVEGAELFATPDARPDERGLQVLTRNGAIDLVTRPARETGRHHVGVESGELRAELEIAFVLPEKPVIATGIVDINLGSYRKSGEGSGVGLQHFDNGVELDAESRIFVQGATVHGINLTARLDTKKRFDDPLLKDTSPDRQYPIYGDASTLRYAAPSQGGNYVSLDRGESFVRYGDFRAPLDRGEFLMYQRATTGLNGSLIHQGDAFTFFVAETDFATRLDEMRADGTSGFYYLSRKPIVEYSEKVVVETRDRFRPERILDIRPMIRNQDYTINPFDGSILFKYPLVAFDAEFNPVTIVVSYEVETHDDKSWLFGMRGDVVRSQRTRAGVVGVSSSGNYSLLGADGEVRSGGFSVGGEVARSESDAGGTGNAFQIQAAYEQSSANLSFYHRRIDGPFDNPSFRGSNHELASLKSGFKGQLRVNGAVTIAAAGWAHRLHRTDEYKENTWSTVSWRHRLLELQAGLRTARHDDPIDERRGLLSIAGIRLGSERSLGVATRWEKNVDDDTVEDFPDRLTTLASAPLGSHAKLMLSHEYSTAPGRAGSNQLAAGVEGMAGRGTRVYSKYSLDRLAGESRMGAVSGVGQSVRLGNRVAGTLGVEGFRSLADREDEEYVSVKTGLGLRVPGSHFVEGQYENRWQRSRTRHMWRIDAAQQWRTGTGWLTKNVLSLADGGEKSDELSYHGTLAGAYRPTVGSVQTLAMIRNHYERRTPVDPDAIRWRIVFSADANWTHAPGHEIRLKYGFKHVEDYSFGVSTNTDADLILGQYVYRFHRNWDVDVWGRWLGRRRGGGAETGSGIEIGRLFFRSVRLAGGYSVGGFDDPDFIGTDAWSRGFNLRMQLILSEWLLPDFERINQ